MPDTHVVVLKASDIVPTVPQAVDILGKNPTRPMTWIAGGSATSVSGAWASPVFKCPLLGVFVAPCCGSTEMSHAIPV